MLMHLICKRANYACKKQQNKEFFFYKVLVQALLIFNESFNF